MVDAVNNVHAITKVAQGPQVEKSEDRRKEDAKVSDSRREVREQVQDEVTLSAEAQEIARAEQATQETRAELERNADQALTSGGRLDTLL
ncbi:MAG: hypothetical protein IT559_04160 [Alphaproteobacteria bacterium]|nr:hypothetical protein [Alphaproteobacteria bacterium]